jgi:hypothetical protein
MNENEPNVDDKKTLRWFFKEDPRSQGAKIPRGVRVVTLRIAGFVRFWSSRDATLLGILVEAQFIDETKRGQPETEVNRFELQLPPGRGRNRKHIYMEYDFSNTKLATAGRELYALYYYRRQPLTLGYVE